MDVLSTFKDLKIKKSLTTIPWKTAGEGRAVPAGGVIRDLPWKTAGGGRAVPAGGVIRDGHAGLEKASGVNRNGCKDNISQK